MSDIILAQELATFGVSLHQAILDQLVGEIKGAIVAGRIRIDTPRSKDTGILQKTALTEFQISAFQALP
jgi:hypothetical protein